jgi:Macrocin-O-methyltransferase (TylF)
MASRHGGCQQSMSKESFRSIFRHFGYDLVRDQKRGPIYYRDGLWTDHVHEFVSDARFDKAYRRGLKGMGSEQQAQGPWRVHVATWAAEQAMRLEGDFVECGVFLGFTSSIVMTFLDWNEVAGGRKFFLVDNFEGIVSTQLSPQEQSLGRQSQYGTKYSGTYEVARKNLSEFKNTIIVKGTVPDVLPEVTTAAASYLHLDMNAALPEVEALRFFWNKMKPGAVILMDDYAYAGHEPQHRALNNLGKELGFTALALPTGQGIVIK